MNPITGLLAALATFNAGFMALWGKAMLSAHNAVKGGAPVTPDKDLRLPNGEQLAIGFITNFFDTLGIGSYAPTTSWFKIRKIVNDRVIPGTMTVGHNLSTMVQTFIYTAIVPVDVTTLFSMIGAAIAGAYLGAGIVAKWPKRNIQLGMGSLLLIAATLMFLSNGGPFFQLTGMNVLPGGGNATGVNGVKLVIAVAVNFMLGAFMTIGIGLYAPCMITICLLGMNPTVAFPIMMGSCAFLMPIAAVPFVREKSYSNRPALGLTLAGLPGVIIAAVIVVSMDVNKVKWLVVGVVLYTSISMLRSALGSNGARETIAETSDVASINPSRDGRSDNSKGLAAYGAFCGLLLGAFIGFMMRPGQELPFSAVISRGRLMDGIDQALLPLAQQSFNYLIAGSLLGALALGVFAYVYTTRARQTLVAVPAEKE